MGKYLDSLTLNVSPDYAKKKKLTNEQHVSIISNNFTFPALVCFRKKVKETPTLLENDCIPNSLNTNKFTVEGTVPWLYAHSIIFSHTAININNCNILKDIRTEHSTFRKLPTTFSTSNLCKLLKEELINSQIILKMGLKIRLNYLSQKFIFIVKDVTRHFHGFSEEFTPDGGYKVSGDTHIDIIEDKSEKSKDNFSFKNFGGYENEIKTLEENIKSYLEGSSSISGILIAGISGTGKTYLCSILGSVYESICAVYGSEDIISRYKGETETTLRKLFEKANKRVPSIIVIDNIDEICSSRNEDTINTRIVNAFLHLIDSGQGNQRTLVIATASNPDKLDQALRRSGRLSHDINLNIPDEKSRKSILRHILRKYDFDDEFYDEIASKTSGFVASDLMNLISEAFLYFKEEPRIDHFRQALIVVQPAALKNVPTPSYNVSMDDVLCYNNVKSELVSQFELTLRNRELLLANDLSNPSRILLFGPTGCGKSFLAHAVASYFNLNVITVRRSNVFGKYFGESEKNLGALFEQAEKSSPCILHFENLVGIAGRRGRDSEVSNDVEGRVINHLKVLLDGMQEFHNIYIIAETNRPDLLDQDVIRHGRFHKYIYVDLPSRDDRRTLLETNLKSIQWNAHPESWPFDELADKTKGFSVAEVKLFCKEILNTLEEKLESSNTWDAAATNHFSSVIEEAFGIVSASTSAKMMKKYQDFSAIYNRN